MNDLLKKMMVALLSLGLAQAVLADDVLDFKKHFKLRSKEMLKPNFI